MNAVGRVLGTKQETKAYKINNNRAGVFRTPVLYNFCDMP